MHSPHLIHSNSFIYQRVIYRKISLELGKIWIRQGLRECALTYNVATLNVLLLAMGTQAWGHPRRVCLGQALRASWLVIKACQRQPAQPPPQPCKGKAEKTSSQDLRGGQHSEPRLTPEQLPRSERRAGREHQLSASSHTLQVPRARVRGRVSGQAPPVFFPCRVKAAMSSHEKPLGRNPSSPYNEQMPHRLGASFVNDFKVYLSTPRRLLESPTAFYCNCFHVA